MKRASTTNRTTIVQYGQSKKAHVSITKVTNSWIDMGKKNTRISILFFLLVFDFNLCLLIVMIITILLLRKIDILKSEILYDL